MRHSIGVVLFAGVCIAAFTSATARQIDTWSYDRLFKEADVIVIATAQATIDTEQKATDARYTASLVGQKTTFIINSVLKGKPQDEPLNVQHFRLKDGLLSQNGPLLVSFRTKSPTIHGNGRTAFEASLGTPQYLLFLKPTADGSYEPVSGQVDPKLSVKEIYSPLPTVIDEK